MRVMFGLSAMAVAVATLTLAAATAGAGPVEVVEEASGDHCWPGPVHCVIEMHGEMPMRITAHLLTGPEVVTSECNDELAAEVNEDGTGRIYHQRYGGQNCPSKPCEATGQQTGDGHIWPIRLEETEAGLSLHVVFCLQPATGGDERQCEVSAVAGEPTPHQYVFSATDVECTGTPPPPGIRSIEVDCLWEIEGSPIEVVHL